MKTRTTCLPLFLLLGFVVWVGVGSATGEQASESLDPRRIDLITDSARPFTQVEPIAARLNVHRFELDAPVRLEAQLSEGLPKDPVAAVRLARQRLETLGRERLAARFAAAYAGLLKALEVGIDRYPAVVFDGGESVVYGVTDLSKALEHYRRWRRSREISGE